MCLSSPKVTTVSAPSTAIEQDAAVLSSEEKERRRQATAAGRASTLLNVNGAAGVSSTNAPTGGKTLLGL